MKGGQDNNACNRSLEGYTEEDLDHAIDTITRGHTNYLKPRHSLVYDEINFPSRNSTLRASTHTLNTLNRFKEDEPAKRRCPGCVHFAVCLLSVVISGGVSAAIVYFWTPYLMAIPSTAPPSSGASESHRSCLVDNGGCEDRCVNTNTTYHCLCDNPGLVLADNRHSCTDIDECVNGPCPIGFVCLNSWGSHVCVDPASLKISDLDECQSNPCEAGATCVNTPGSYKCIPAPDIPTPGGALYVRWGRTTCPQDIDTDLVYSGRAAGQHFTDRGGGSNYLCLPSDPEWDDYSAGHSNDTLFRNFLHGAEYELASPGDVFPFVASNARSLDDHDVPCTVCRAQKRSTTMVLPARRSCYNGWTPEYSGYLMSENHEDMRTEFVCVDRAPESAPGGGPENHNGVGLYFVEAVCGAISCPPYVGYRELSCVVCTK